MSTKLGEQLMLKQALALALEKIINKALSLNINDNNKLKPLNEKCVTIILDELAFPLSFSVYQQQILVTSLAEHSDCTIITSLKTLKELQKNQQLTELIKQDKLDITGDIKLAQQFVNVAQNLSIDWQSELAKHIGDFATYKLTRLGKNLANKFNFFKNQVQADSGEYLVHEQKLVVTKDKINEFNQQVKLVNEQAEQLILRLAVIEKKLS
ncbi:MAG: SCP2 sterol-binding domain-containing protein [Alteromonadaceae bacterium]|nr:SCP2 sterol-binding domain-containing protein [Alteromonadaceae bacterium]